MKKLSLLLFAGLFITAMVSSCKKDEPDSAEKFSKLSVEENKALVETAGVDFVKVFRRMESIETIDVIANLGDIMSSSGEPVAILAKDSKLFSTMETFAAAANREKKINDVFDAMASSGELAEDPESIQQFWNENVGTYNWDPELNDWIIELGGTTFIFKFPSSDVATTNDATLTVYNYTGVNISNPVDEEYTGDLPASLNADLKVGTKTLISILFAAEYNADGVPKVIASDLTIENFKFEIDLTNTTKLVSVNYKFLENTNVILDLGASGEGLFTEANFDSNTHTENDTYSYYDYRWNPNTQQYEEVLVTYTDTWEETDFEEIINSAKAHFQLFNIAIRGDINVKGLVDQIRIIDGEEESEEINEETAENRRASKINEYLNLRLVNVTNDQILAKAEAYVVKETYSQYMDTYIDFRLTFGDESLIDLETYFDSGFNDFITELNGLINDINSDYEVGLENVEY